MEAAADYIEGLEPSLASGACALEINLVSSKTKHMLTK